MSNCPNCGYELPPMTEEDFRMILEQLKQNKAIMRELGEAAAQQYIKDKLGLTHPRNRSHNQTQSI